VDEPSAYQADGVLYLSPEARYDYLLPLPEASNIGAKVNSAMREIEKHNPQLAVVLPKSYNLFTGTLLKDLLRKVSEIPANVDYDAFGRIYEYFLRGEDIDLTLGGSDVESKIREAYSPEMYNQKCTAVFEHVYERYPERNASVYS
jgi:type I restriction enzyme M protein